MQQGVLTAGWKTDQWRGETPEVSVERTECAGLAFLLSLLLSLLASACEGLGALPPKVHHLALHGVYMYMYIVLYV